MIRLCRKSDVSAVLQIWLHTNIEAHSFISENYWTNNYKMIKEILPKAEIYVYEDDRKKRIEGFIGLQDNFIAGLFVRETARSQGIGKQLLDYAKGIKANISLCVYQKNIQAVHFYQREKFHIQSENIDINTNEKEYVMSWGK